MLLDYSRILIAVKDCSMFAHLMFFSDDDFHLGVRYEVVVFYISWIR